MKSYKTFLSILLMAGVLSACDWTDDGPEEHVRVAGVVLYVNGVEIARYEEGVVSGEITVAEGEETELILARFLDYEGEFVDESRFEEEHSLQVTVTDAAVAGIEQHEDEEWEFHVLGLEEGSATVVVRLMHGDHKDFEALGIPVEVTEVPAA